MLFVSWGRGVVGCGAEDGHGGVGIGEEGCFGQGDCVFEVAYKVSQEGFSFSAHGRKEGKKKKEGIGDE